MNAWKSYDRERGGWGNHAALHIKATIREFIRDKTKGYRVPAWVYESLYKVEAFRRQYWKDHNGAEPTIKEVAKALDMKYHKVKELMEIDQRTTSLDIDISEEGDGITIADTIEDPDARFEDEVIESMFISEFIQKVTKYLTEDELKALGLTMGLNCRRHQLKEVAEILEISDTYAAELRNKAFRKIRRSGYAMQLQRELDEITSWYRSPNYETEGISGNGKHSSVERIVLEREENRKKVSRSNERP